MICTVTTFEPSHVANRSLRGPRHAALVTGASLLLVMDAIARPVPVASRGRVWQREGVAVGTGIGTAAPAAPAARRFGTTEMVRDLKSAGLPVSAIADMMGVERKTVYSWLDGVEARNARLARLEAFHELLRHEETGALKWFHRYWERPLEGGATLKHLLTSERTEPDRIRAALRALRPAVERAMENERRRAHEGMEDGPPGLMNLHLTAAASR